TNVRKGGYAHNLYVGMNGRDSLYGNAQNKGKFKEYRETKTAVNGGKGENNREALIRDLHGPDAKVSDFDNVPTIQLYHQAKVKLSDQDKGFMMVDWKGAAMGAGKSAITEDDSMTKSVLAGSGQYGNWASG